jgi:hypothetical protein
MLLKWKEVSPMADSDLTPADAAVLRYLKQRVDNLQDERWRRDARPSIERLARIYVGKAPAGV